MSYVIASYVIVLGSLVVYGVWVARQRRALMRDPEGRSRRDSEAVGR